MKVEKVSFINKIDIKVVYAITEKYQPETGQAISRKGIAVFIGTLVKNPALHVKANLGISKP